MVYTVHGVADRDPNELVLMFFESINDVKEFVSALPGRYATTVISGIDLEDIDWTCEVFDKRCVICDDGIRIGEEPHTDEATDEDCHARCCSKCNGGVA